ncbi:MAG: ATPase, partial [Treponemataceae bacterium]|nr:ATPase [Treponemataceae bacterium]
MIVPMKKVSIVVLNRERKQALEKLKDVGVVHLEQLEGSGEQLAAYKEASANALAAVAVLSDIKLPKKRQMPAPLSNDAVARKCADVIELSEKKKKLLEEIAADSAEIERFAFWGEVDPEDFAFLKEKGLAFKLFEIPEDKYALIDDSVRTLCVNRQK